MVPIKNQSRPLMVSRPGIDYTGERRVHDSGCRKFARRGRTLVRQYDPNAYLESVSIAPCAYGTACHAAPRRVQDRRHAQAESSLNTRIKAIGLFPQQLDDVAAI